MSEGDARIIYLRCRRYISAVYLRKAQVSNTCGKFHLYPQVDLPVEAFTCGRQRNSTSVIFKYVHNELQNCSFFLCYVNIHTPVSMVSGELSLFFLFFQCCCDIACRKQNGRTVAILLVKGVQKRLIDQTTNELYWNPFLTKESSRIHCHKNWSWYFQRKFSFKIDKITIWIGPFRIFGLWRF